MGFLSQGYWSGLPCSPPGDLPDPGIKPTSLISPALVGGFFTTSTTWEARQRAHTWTQRPNSPYRQSQSKSSCVHLYFTSLNSVKPSPCCISFLNSSLMIFFTLKKRPDEINTLVLRWPRLFSFKFTVRIFP